MDWANERYIRVYIRDTLTWKRMRFEGQTVFMHVARKLDRAGRLPLDGMSPAEAISILTDVPEDFAVAGFDRLLSPDLGVFQVVRGSLIAPNWVEAQEAKASPAQRQRESREKRKAGQGVTDENEASPPVTDSDSGVTGSGEVSHAVTPSLAEPSLTSPPSLVGGDPSPRSVLEAFAEAYTLGTKRREFERGIDSATAGDLQYLREMRDKCDGDVDDFIGRIAAKMAGNASFASGCGIRWWATDAMNSPAVPLPSKAAQPEDPRMQGAAYQEFKG